jgi:hypothetical protein
VFHKPALYQGTTGVPSNRETVAAMEMKEIPTRSRATSIAAMKAELKAND